MSRTCLRKRRRYAFSGMVNEFRTFSHRFFIYEMNQKKTERLLSFHAFQPYALRIFIDLWIQLVTIHKKFTIEEN